MSNDYPVLISIFSKAVLLVLLVPITPMLLKETKVPNGLGLLRKMIFLALGSFLLANVTVGVFQVFRLFIPINQFLLDLASMLTSCATIIAGIVLNTIYSGRYHGKS